MFITALLSMFISNTATVATMIPLVSAYCEAKYAYGMNHKKRNLLLLSVAYAANIGGTGIITGSPPNLLVLTHLKAQYIYIRKVRPWLLICFVHPIFRFWFFVTFGDE